MKRNTLSPPDVNQRLLSLDVFRGFTMFLLIAESTHLFNLLVDPSLQGTLIETIGRQFHHHPWNGLRFWDLVQPFFMFIVGVAMPFTFARREERGDSRCKMIGHAVKRSLILLFLGWALYCIGPGKITFEFRNVLAQLSFTYLVAFLWMRKSGKAQFIFTIGLLVLTELLYRFWPVAGFNQPFVPDQNFGSYIDMLLMGKLSGGHWVAFNAVPTTAHTMWGVLAGLVLRSQRSEMQKVKILLFAGLLGVVLGFALNPLTPIIKRICTSSFVIVSGGWCLIVLAFWYWLVDVKKVRKFPIFFTIVGLNPIFIYLFAETGGTQWLSRIISPFTLGLFGWIGDLPSQLITGITLWFLLWSICYFLYRRRIFIKI
ncbi:acyltransferase family protein [bacterium]